VTLRISMLLLAALVCAGASHAARAVTTVALPPPRCESQCAFRQAHLKRLDLLDSFTFVSKGCFGTCPSYEVTFNKNGVATITNIRFVPELKRLAGLGGTANVPFAKIRALLASSKFATFAPEYPLHATDMWGVSLSWQYSDGFSYDVYAPDHATWPNSLGSLVTSVMQLVRDTDWH